MATIPYTVSDRDDKYPGDRVYTWTGLGNGDDGQPIPGYVRSAVVQVTGTFGSGGAAAMQLSNNRSTYSPIISIGTAGHVGLDGPVVSLRPAVTGDGSTSLTIRVAVTRPE
jgi:hypothetical protein